MGHGIYAVPNRLERNPAMQVECAEELAGSCLQPLRWNLLCGVERSGGCGGLCPLRWLAGTRTSSRIGEGGSPRGERNVPPFGCYTGARTSTRMAARERSERARERSERASTGARVPRAYARGEILSTSVFLVRWLYVFLCNRAAHLLMRKLASEHLDVVLEYTQ